MTQIAPAPPPAKLILASGSVYRRQMLERLNWPFEVIPADIDETAREGEGGEALALRLARQKAEAVAAGLQHALVLGCDQVAECQGRLLGKPGSIERALEQLSFTAGKEIVFHSAMALIGMDQCRVVSVPTRVRMKTLSQGALMAYVERDKPLDCAGAMRSESLGIALTESIRSDDPTALIGLPLIRLTELLGEFGIDVLER
jgi:septum formation protein